MGSERGMTTETLPAPVEVTTPILPSEAMRLGCLLSPRQEFGNYFGEGRDTSSSCALGAMRLGYGDDHLATMVAEERIIDMVGSSPCHLCGEPDMEAWPPHLNDEHRWTREAIADYLAERGL